MGPTWGKQRKRVPSGLLLVTHSERLGLFNVLETQMVNARSSYFAIQILFLNPLFLIFITVEFLFFSRNISEYKFIILFEGKAFIPIFNWLNFLGNILRVEKV